MYPKSYCWAGTVICIPDQQLAPTLTPSLEVRGVLFITPWGCWAAQGHSIQGTKTFKMATRKSRDLDDPGLPECWRGEPKERLMTQLLLAYGYSKMAPLKPLALSFHIRNKNRRPLSCIPSTNAWLRPPTCNPFNETKAQQCWIKYTGLVDSQPQMPTISADGDHMASRGVKETLPL